MFIIAITTSPKIGSTLPEISQYPRAELPTSDRTVTIKHSNVSVHSSNNKIKNNNSRQFY